MAKQTSMHITIGDGIITVRAGTLYNPGNRKFKNESAFWYALKQELMSKTTHLVWEDCQPFDLVKKVMAKDGHMVGGDTYPYYLRDRKWRFYIYDAHYAVRDVAEALYKGGAVVLHMVRTGK